MAKLPHTRIKTNNTLNSSIRSDEGLTLETSAFQIVHRDGGNSTFINTFDKNQISLFHSPTDAAPQFLWKLEICSQSVHLLKK